MPARRLGDYEGLSRDDLAHLLTKKEEEIGVLRKRNATLKRKLRVTEELSLTDELTGLGNFRAARRLITRLLKFRRKVETQNFLVLIDLDNFKLVNDEVGHNSGDFVLRSFAEILRSSLPAGTFAARWKEGDEFIIVLSGVDETAADSLVKKLRVRLEEFPFPFTLLRDEERVFVTFSYGLVPLIRGMEMNMVIENADHVMYGAKRRRGQGR